MAQMGRPPRPVLERFAKRAQFMSDGCIKWTGNLDRDGYGSFLPAGGRSVRSVRVHRWAYEYFVGPIPDGMVIDHVCHTRDLTCAGGIACAHRQCVNPAHLEAVTPTENWLRGQGPARINADKTHCPRGHSLSGENLRVSRIGGRYCRTCKRAQSAANYQKKRAA